MAIRFLLRLSFIGYLLFTSLILEAKADNNKVIEGSFEMEFKEFFDKKRGKKHFKNKIKEFKKRKKQKIRNNKFNPMLFLLSMIKTFFGILLVAIGLIEGVFTLFAIGVIISIIGVLLLAMSINQLLSVIEMDALKPSKNEEMDWK